jgi:hypothetical protein
MNTHRHRSILLSFILIPLIIVSFLVGIFSIVGLRSNVRAMEYSIASLEKTRAEILKERKMLLAEKASVLSIKNVKSRGDGQVGLIFPDRTKVTYVKQGDISGPLKASLEKGNPTGH